MQAIKRYLLLAVTLVLVSLLYFAIVALRQRGYLLQHVNNTADRPRVAARGDDARSFVTSPSHGSKLDIHVSARARRKAVPANITDRSGRSGVLDGLSQLVSAGGVPYTTVGSTKSCSMETCFDFSLCAKGFRVYVYPERGSSTVSNGYRAVLAALLESRFYTMEPSEACVFVLAIDTLDRDALSPDHTHNVPGLLHGLQPWTDMDGRNHVIFNMFSGSWPSYSENLGFDYRRAILAKTSVPSSVFRHGFDVSLPLFGKEHPPKGGERGQARESPVSSPKYLLTFKGKRYLKGKGSDARNALYHVHNARDIVLLTTCRHGKNWKVLADDRCDEDNKAYDDYDFKKLLMNSTFCLVPRGRRLGSYRFLEALQMGCIPVLLSNDWRLPFYNHIDWGKAVVWADERLLLQLPSIVRSIKKSQILALRQQTQFLWETYFSSIDKIIHATLMILHDRITPHLAHSRFIWNNNPGALAICHRYADTLAKFPFFYKYLQLAPDRRFTAVIYATTPVLFTSSPLFRIIRTVLKAPSVHRVIVIWHCDGVVPAKHLWPTSSTVPIVVITKHSQTISGRFYPYKAIETDAVLSLDEDSLLTVDEMEFSFSVWREFPEQIVGFPSRNHLWNEAKSRWSYTSKWTNHYSMVLTGSAFYHRYYHHVYTYTLSPLLTQLVDQSHDCDDILMNFVVGHLTKLPSIKVTQRRLYKETLLPVKRPRYDPERLAQRDYCFNSFVATYGYVPLTRSNVRLDPMLFKDPVSNLRKKYRQIEVV